MFIFSIEVTHLDGRCSPSKPYKVDALFTDILTPDQYDGEHTSFSFFFEDVLKRDLFLLTNPELGFEAFDDQYASKEIKNWYCCTQLKN